MKKLGKFLFCFVLFLLFPAVSQADGITLTLRGEEAVSWPCGIPYVDEGYTAQDLDGNDLSGAVRVSGEVDFLKCGEYVLRYSVTDGPGGSAEVCRTVKVSPVSLPEKHGKAEKTIYLTYDDGPSEYTEELLDLLDEYDAKATFFVINHAIEKRPEIIRAAFERGHSIGIHSNKHDYNYLYVSEENFLEDISSVRELIFDLIGQRPDIFRFPGGSETAFRLASNHIDGGFETLKNDLADLGIEYFDWNDSADPKGTSPTEAVFRIISSAEKRGSLVVILHDTRYSSIPATRRLLEMGAEKGFAFQSLDASVEAVQQK